MTTNAIYFGLVNPSIDLDYETCFFYNDTYYYYKLEWDDTFELKLVDTSNRYVPIDVASFRQFKEAFYCFYKDFGGKEASELAAIAQLYEEPIEMGILY